MLLPRIDCDIAPPEDACAFLYEAAQELLDAASAGLEQFIPTEGSNDCVEFETYVSMGVPVAEKYDALSIHLVRYGLHPQTRRQIDQTSCGPVPPRHVATWRMELWENGYPVGKRSGAAFTPPTAAQLSAVNAHLYAHGIAAYDALAVAVATNDLDLPSVIDTVTVDDMVPLGPQGAAAGWAWGVLTEVNG